ncbi:MAG: ATP-binding protein [Gammaproteobacteria bacterium]|nr:ATP-binding protein [Gammaproteobacteria bacterium]
MRRPNQERDSRLVAIVGPESSGKSTLAKELAQRYRGVWLPEYARGALPGTSYEETDVAMIAREQLARENDFCEAEPTFGVLDTDGIVLQIWFKVRFGHVPEFLLRHIASQNPREYLLTYRDLPWEPDPQRESKDDLTALFDLYETTLQAWRFDYQVVRGIGERRVKNALDLLNAQRA